MSSIPPPSSSQPDPEPAQQAPAAGWYPDPSGSGLRWWDGSGWTDNVHADEAESSPAAETQTQVVEPQPQQPMSRASGAQNDAEAKAVASLPGLKSASDSKAGDDGFGKYRLPVLLVLLMVLLLIFALTAL